MATSKRINVDSLPDLSAGNNVPKTINVDYLPELKKKDGSFDNGTNGIGGFSTQQNDIQKPVGQISNEQVNAANQQLVGNKDVHTNSNSNQYLQETDKAAQQAVEDRKVKAANNTASVFFKNNPQLIPENESMMLKNADTKNRGYTFSLKNLPHTAAFQNKAAQIKSDLDSGKLTTYKTDEGELRAAYPMTGLKNTVANFKQVWNASDEANKVLSMSGDDFKNYAASKPDNEYLPTKPDAESLSGQAGQGLPIAIKGGVGVLGGTVMSMAAPETLGISTAGLPTVMAWAMTAPDMAKTQAAQAKVKAYRDALQQGKNPDEALSIANNMATANYAEGMALGTALTALPSFISKGANEGFLKAFGNHVAMLPYAAGTQGLTAGGLTELKDEYAKHIGLNITDEQQRKDFESSFNGMIAPTIMFGVVHGLVDANGAAKAQAKNGISKIPPEQLHQMQDAMVNEGVLTQDQVNDANKSLQDFNNAGKKIIPTGSEEKDAVMKGLIEKRDALKESKTTIDESYHPEIDAQIEDLNNRISLAKNSKDPIKYAEQDGLTGQPHFTPKEFEELTPKEKNNIDVPTDFGKASTKSKGEESVTPIVEVNNQPVKVEGTFTDKDKAQAAADEKLKEIYYNNKLSPLQKPESNEKIKSEEVVTNANNEAGNSSNGFVGSGKEGKTEKGNGETLQSQQKEITPEQENFVKSFIVGEDGKHINNTLDRINNAEYINEKDLDKAADGLYSLWDKVDNKSLQNLIEPLISKIENYDFRTKTESSKVTEKVPVEVANESRKPTVANKSLSQWEGNRATVTDQNGKAIEGQIKSDNGKYGLFDNDGNKISDLGEKALTDRDITLPSKEDVPQPIEFDKDGNVKSVTLQINKLDKENGGTIPDKQITIQFKDPEKALDYAIQLRAEQVGEVPQPAFDLAYQEIQKEIQQEVPVKDLSTKPKVENPKPKSEEPENPKTNSVVEDKGETKNEGISETDTKNISQPLNTEQESKVDASNDEGDVSGVKKAITQPLRSGLNLPKVELPKMGGDVGNLEKAKVRVDKGESNPLDLVDRILKDKNGFRNEDEVFDMQYYGHQLKQQEGNLKAKYAEAETETEKASVSGQIHQLSDEVDRFTEASQTALNKWGKIGNAAQVVVDEGFNPSREKLFIKDAYGGEIPKDVQLKIDAVTKERDVALTALKEVEEKLKKAQAEKALGKFKKAVGKNKEDIAKLKDEAEQLKQQLRQAFKKDLGNINAGIPIPKETLEVLGKLAINYLKQGALTVDAIASKIYDDLKDEIKEPFTKKDVRDWLTNAANITEDVETARLNRKAQNIEDKVTPTILDKEGKPREQKPIIPPKSQIKAFQNSSEWVKANQRVINAEYKMKVLKRQAFESQKNWYQKGLMWFGRLTRLSVLSGYNVLYKLGAASTIGGALKRIPEQAFGGIYSQIFKGIAEKAPIEGSLNALSEAKFYKEFFNPKKFVHNTWEILKTGESDLSKKFSTGKYEHVKGLYLPTDLHQIIKDPLKRSTFESSFRNALIHAEKNGLDINDPLIINSIESAAFKRANYEIFQEQNALTKKFTAWKNQMEKSGNIGATGKFLADFLVPVSTVPTNIVRRLVTTSPIGLIRGGIKVVEAYRKGVESLSNEQADAVMRQLKQGSFGTALWLVGWFGYSHFGGLYSKYDPDKKRREGELASDEMEVDGSMIPAPVQHALPFEIIQWAATARRIHENYTDKKDANEFTSIYNAGLGSIGALIEQIPIIEETGHLIGAASEPYEANKLKDDVERRFEPQILRETGVIPKETKQIKSSKTSKTQVRQTPKRQVIQHR